MTEAATPTVSDIVADLQRQRFYGSLEIVFQAGQVVLFKKVETIKPNERNNRGPNAKTEPH